MAAAEMVAEEGEKEAAEMEEGEEEALGESKTWTHSRPRCDTTAADVFFGSGDANPAAAAVSGFEESSDGTTFPMCDCGGVRVGSTRVTRDTPNKGRLYYFCASHTCKFFQWAEGKMPMSTASASSSSGTELANALTPSQPRQPKLRQCNKCRKDISTRPSHHYVCLVCFGEDVAAVTF